MEKGQKIQDESQKEAKRILERVAQESETVGTSSMRRVAERFKDHLQAEDANHDRWTEVWGTRIGRGLGIIFVGYLIYHLVKTYILHQ